MSNEHYDEVEAFDDEPPKGFFRRHRTAGIIGGGLGTLGMAGVAFALVLSTTAVTGGFNFQKDEASDSIAYLALRGENGLECQVSNTPEKVNIEATATRTVSEDGADQGGSDVPNQTCNLEARLVNTGDVTLYINAVKSDASYTGPEGWQIGGLKDDHGVAIEPNQYHDVKFFIQIDDEGTPDPGEGPISATFFTQTEPPASS